MLSLWMPCRNLRDPRLIALLIDDESARGLPHWLPVPADTSATGISEQSTIQGGKFDEDREIPPPQ